MDEAMLKSGQYPNVAIEAGTDPREVMREYGRVDKEDVDSREVIPNAEKYELDSREKLDVDIYKAVQNIYFAGYNDGSISDPSTCQQSWQNGRERIVELLERQAAITERELCVECEWPLLAAQPDEESYDRIAELEAERDELRVELGQWEKLAANIKLPDYPITQFVPKDQDTREQFLNGICGSKSEKTPEIALQDGVLNNFDVQNDTLEHSKAECPHSNVSQNLSDTSERLEADLNNLCLDCLGLGWNAANDLKKAIRKLLDRQAEITRRECKRENIEWQQDLIDNLNELDNTAELIDKLTAERDEWKANAIQASESYLDAKSDRDKLQADLKTANDTINTLRASVAGLKMTVERLTGREPADMGN